MQLPLDKILDVGLMTTMIVISIAWARVLWGTIGPSPCWKEGWHEIAYLQPLIHNCRRHHLRHEHLATLSFHRFLPVDVGIVIPRAIGLIIGSLDQLLKSLFILALAALNSRY